MVSTSTTVHGPAALSADEYRPRFGNWGARASVRTKPLRTLDEQFGGIPHDGRLVSAVPATVADHEGRRHTFFVQFFEYAWHQFEYAWHQLGPRQRAAIGPMLPDFVLAFLYGLVDA